MDEQGKGRIYGYDPVGCVEELNQCSGGAGVTLMQSLLDNQVKNLVHPFVLACGIVCPRGCSQTTLTRVWLFF